MKKADMLGFLEFQCLAAALHLGPTRAYGMTIRLTILEATGRDVLVGTVYSTLDRLKAKGYIKIRMGESTPERGGRAKEFIELTGEGLQAYRYTFNAQLGMMNLSGVAPSPAV